MNRWRTRGLTIAVATALLVLAAAGWIALPEIVRRAVVWGLGGATGRAVELADVELTFRARRIVLRGLRVLDHDQQPLVTVERLEVRLSPRALLRGHVRVVDASAQAPTVRLVRTGPRAFNVSDLFEGKPGGRAVAVTLDRLVLTGGAVSIEDRTLVPPRRWRVDAVALDAHGLSTVGGTPPGIASLSAVAAGAPISVWVTGARLAPLRLHATVIAREIDASLVALYLPPASPLSPARGILHVSGTIEHDASSGTRVGLDAGFADVELRRPGQPQAFLSSPTVRVRVEDLRVRPGALTLGRLSVEAGTVVLQDAQLAPARRWQADAFALEIVNASSVRQAAPGVATARAVVAGSPVSIWVTNFRLDPVELHATAIVRNVDAALLRLYLPPGQPAQVERGLVNASIQADHDASRGTRVTLDAAISDVELKLPAHVVTAPSLRLLVEDVVLGRGVVTVARVGLTGDLLTVEDRTRAPVLKWPVQNLAVEATRLSSRREDVQGVATARATVAGAPVSIFATRVRLEPLALHVTAMLRRVDLPFVEPYLPRQVPLRFERGAIDASFRMDYERADGVRFDADASLTGVAARSRDADGPRVEAPSLRVTLGGGRHQGEAFSLDRFELDGRGSLTGLRAGPDRLDVERWRLAAERLTWPAQAPARVELSARLRDGSEVNASGTVQLTAPLPALAWAAELAVELGGINLEPFAAAVPAARGLRGRVRGTLTGAVAWTGAFTARVRGDASAAPLALVEDGRTLAGVRRVQALGLDVQWPERVAVRRLELTQPDARIERDRRGEFPLAVRFAPRRPSSAVPPAPPAAGDVARLSLPAIEVGEVVVEGGSVAFTDQHVVERAGIDVARLDVTLRDVTWPPRAPMRVKLGAALSTGGTLAAEGTVSAGTPAVDLRITTAGIDLGLLQPYLPFAARVRARLDATLAVAGPLAPAPRLTARGTVTVRQVTFADRERPVLTVARIDATGIDAVWPERVSIDAVRVQRSWALIERDRQGEFLLRTVLQQRPIAHEPPGPRDGPATAAASPFEIRVRDASVEQAAATIVDAITTPPARFEVAGARMSVQDFAWPARGPVKIELSSPMPGGGTLAAAGTVDLGAMRLETRAVLDGVALEPAQPYLPIEGRVEGRVSGELTTRIALAPLAVQLGGQVRLQRFRLRDGDRPLITVGRVETAGIDVDWPRRVAVESVRLARPRLLIERGADGDFAITRIVTPRRVPDAAVAGEPAAPSPGGAAALPAATGVDIGTLRLDRASVRFVDQTTRPPYTEELNGVELSLTGLTTAPGRRVRFAASGEMPGGASFKVVGDGVTGAPPRLGLEIDLRDVVVPRANPYVDRFTAWTVTRGTLSATARYALDGTRLDARHDVVLRHLEVERSAADDHVEARLGLPLGFLVSLLKNARNEIRLSLPVSGDVGTGTFDFGDAVWGAVRAVVIRALALPFSRIGSLFVSEDSKVTAVTVEPVAFEPGSARLTPAMQAHLDRIAAFLRDTPAARLHLAPILTLADAGALKHAAVQERLETTSAPADARALDTAQQRHRERWPDRPVPPSLEAIVAALAAAEPTPTEGLQALAASRGEAVRQHLAGVGVDASRLRTSVRRTALVEAGGSGRVELDVRP